MDLTGIISISGRPGLYKVVAQAKNNIIVESLEDQKRFPAYSSDRISALEDISVYTYDDDVSFKEVLKSIYDKEKGGTCVSHKADKKELEAYLTEIMPNYDQERVYISDVKKIFQWYNLLHKADLIKFEEEKPKKAKASEAKEGEEVKEPKEKVKKVAATTKKATTPKKAATTAKPKASATGKKTATKTTAVKKATSVKTGVSRGK